ncbi:MAG: lipopolysaccharide biosynthesis protein [Hungatella sp.]|nr:lipopolysaccharide biosynthesis protein [Hungatella sp.]
MKQKVIKGLFWKILENGGAQGIQFVVAIILARLLTPAEYGVVGIIMIFITIANVIVQNGFSTALVQKQQADEKDFSSVCYFSLGAAFVMYGILYAAAPQIANFYDIEQLKEIVRVLGVVLFPGAVISVQTAWVSRKMEFKGLFLSTLGASIISGVISIYMAYRGFGVWAMVGQQLAYYFALMLVLFVTVSWKPAFLFAWNNIWELLGFGWKLLAASLIDTLFNNLYGLIMGKIYNEEILGIYNRGEQFPKLIANNLGAAIQSVLLPAFSSKQGDRQVMKQMLKRAVRISSFLVLPMLFGLCAVADTLVLGLLGEKWLDCVPYLRIMCVAYSFWPIHITNLQAVNAAGRSDMFLKLEIIKKSMGIIGVVVGIQFGPLVLMAIKASLDFLSTFVNAWPNKKLLGYGIFNQWVDILPSVAISLIMCAAVYGVQFVLPGGVWIKLIVQVIFGAGVYIVLAKLFRLESFEYLWSLIKSRREKKEMV